MISETWSVFLPVSHDSAAVHLSALWCTDDVTISSVIYRDDLNSKDVATHTHVSVKLSLCSHLSRLGFPRGSGEMNNSIITRRFLTDYKAPPLTGLPPPAVFFCLCFVFPLCLQLFLLHYFCSAILFVWILFLPPHQRHACKTAPGDASPWKLSCLISLHHERTTLQQRQKQWRHRRLWKNKVVISGWNVLARLSLSVQALMECLHLDPQGEIPPTLLTVQRSKVKVHMNQLFFSIICNLRGWGLMGWGEAFKMKADVYKTERWFLPPPDFNQINKLNNNNKE